MITVDLYTRVSTDNQEDNSSLEEQERQCREFCAAHGLVIGEVWHEVFTGYQYREREQLNLMRRRIREGVIQGIVVRTVERLTRRQVHAAILLEELEHHHCKLYSVIEPEADDSVMGQFVRSVLAFLAEIEREKIIDRTITGRLAKARAGKIVAGRAPRYGWKWNDPETKDCLVVDEPAADIIRWAANLYADGVSLVVILKQLNERGVPTVRGAPRWERKVMRRILLDVRNTGKGAQLFTHPQKRAKRNLEPVDLPDGTFPAIFDDELYQRVVQRAQANKDDAVRNGKNPEAYLLRAGFVRCAECNHAMIGVDVRDTRRRNSPRLVYSCSNTHSRNGHRVPAPRLDTEVWAELLKLADHIALIEEAVQLATKKDNSSANLKAVERTIAEWNDKVANYMADLDDRSLRGPTRATIRKSLDAALVMVEWLEGEKQKIIAGAFDRQREQEAYGEILEWCKKIKTAREPLTYQRQRDFLRLLGVQVLVGRRQQRGGDLCYDIRVALPTLQALIFQPENAIAGPSLYTQSRNMWFIGVNQTGWYINPVLRGAA